MISRKIADGWIVRLDTNEKLMASLGKFCEENSITAGWITGLGGALWAELAFYHLDQKAYEFDRIDEALEIANLTGNVSMVNGKPFVHVHCSVADLNFHSYAGHLKELEVSATCEIHIQIFEQAIERVHNDSCGLKIFDLKDAK